MRKKITLTGYRLRKGRITKDNAVGTTSLLLDEGRSLVEAATQADKPQVRKENSFTFQKLLTHARKKGLKLTPVFNRV